MKQLGIIGGSGLTKLDSLKLKRQQVVLTPFGEPSAPLSFGVLDGRSVVFIPRHGAGHSIPPHQVNYRANIWAMQHVGIEQVIGITAVGGITQAPETICVPDQIIDYTWGREHTYVESGITQVRHIDFSEPYCSELRQQLIRAGNESGITVKTQCTYGATQGPRLETAMEIRRMEQDGCDLVGMTGMPEAALAHEIGLCYANCSVVANWAAGKSSGGITMQEIESHMNRGIGQVRRLIAAIR